MQSFEMPLRQQTASSDLVRQCPYPPCLLIPAEITSPANNFFRLQRTLFSKKQVFSQKKSCIVTLYPRPVHLFVLFNKLLPKSNNENKQRPPTNGRGLMDFYHSWTNSILQQLKRNFWKITNTLFRISTMSQ